MGIMEIVAIVGMVGQMVPLVEKLFGAFQGSGPVKKEVVTTAVTSALNGLASVSTGGQKDTVNAILPAVDTLIESTVAIMNGISRMAGGKDLIDNTGTTLEGAGSARMG